MEPDIDKIKQEIISKISEYNLRYIKIPEDLLVAVHDIFFQSIIDESITAGIYLLYVAVYYQHCNKNSVLTEKYYLMAVEKDNLTAINNLAMLYDNENNIDDALKYYLMAIDKGKICAREYLAKFFLRLKRYEPAMESYEKAIVEVEKYVVGSYEPDEDNYISNPATKLVEMHNYIGGWYNYLKSYDSAEKHLQKAVEKGNDDAIINLAICYSCNNKIDTGIKYLLMTIGNKFDSDLVMRIKSNFGEKYKRKWDKKLAYIHDNIVSNFNGRLMMDMVCPKCQEISTVVFLICGHPVCTKCFHEETPCSICSETNLNSTASDVNDQKQRLLNKLLEWDYVYMPIPDNELSNIFDMIVNNIVDEQNQSEIYRFYRMIKRCRYPTDDKLMMDDYSNLFEKGNVLAIINLGIIYQKWGNFNNAEKYFLMAVEKNSPEAMYRLARNYDCKPSEKLAKKYYIMAANEYHPRARKWVNDKLHKKFSLRQAIEAESFLDAANTNMLNNYLISIHNNSETLLNIKLKN